MPRSAALLVVMVGVVLAGCGGGGGGTPLVTWTALPASGNLLPDAQITVSFSASMQNGTAVLGGTLGGQAPVVVWSDGAHRTDTVLVRPVAGSSWTVAGEASLTLSVQDLEGRTVALSLPDYGVIAAADACGTAERACVSAAACVYTDRQLASWAGACASAQGGVVTLQCMSSSEHPLATACVDCYAAAASCKLTACSAALTNPVGPCLASPDSSDCLACIAASCTPALELCSGR